ncbi:RNA 2',3'-cyclic phosphodiesterase [Aliagarivorans marinus]|uniref:RNA 2',3'-cyclic phosphodiesterase n=1 Tax=Aliagarivorans marinus TaxID=561965 RepID=UPI000411DE75|nr:RNA 2',3'-cyclic phosphodiesterase [Aliagarivorans marinus]
MSQATSKAIRSNAHNISQRQRVFFALSPERELRDAIERQAAALYQQCAASKSEAAPHAKLIPARNFHLTLGFYPAASLPELEQLMQLAANVQVSRFQLTLDQLGCFEKAGIAWLGCSEVPKELTALGQVLRPTEPHPFVPHISLLRRFNGSLSRNVQGLSWSVSSFELYRSQRNSHGSVYQRLASWPLVG